MTKEELAEELGYEKVKGAVVLASEQDGKFDIFIKEDELKEFWYKEETDMFYENTEKELTRLCDDEGKEVKEREKKK